MKNKFKKEPKELKKYWDLSHKNKLTKAHTEELIGLYNKYEDACNKCTAAILLSFIDNDDRVPPILFDALNYWSESGYSGWALTSNSRLFNYYPDYRKEYLRVMFGRNLNKKGILVHSLFLFQEPLRGFTKKDLEKIFQNFIKKEKNELMRRFVINQMNLDKNIIFVKSLLKKIDPLKLLKSNTKQNPYEMVAINILSVYRNKKQATQRIKFVFSREFNMVPNAEIVSQIADALLKKI